MFVLKEPSCLPQSFWRCLPSVRWPTGLERLIKTRDTQVSETAVNTDVPPAKVQQTKTLMICSIVYVSVEIFEEPDLCLMSEWFLAVLWLFCLQISIPLSSEAAVSTPTFMRRMRRASSWWTLPRRRRRPTRGTAWGLLRYNRAHKPWTSPFALNFVRWFKICGRFCLCSSYIVMFVSTEEPAQRQGPQEPDAVQHADAPEERQAKGEVRLPALT